VYAARSVRGADKERERLSVFICAERKRIVAGLDNVLDKSAFEIEFRKDCVYFVAVERHGIVSGDTAV
jgi:hypothetical protein